MRALLRGLIYFRRNLLIIQFTRLHLVFQNFMYEGHFSAGEAAISYATECRSFLGLLPLCLSCCFLSVFHATCFISYLSLDLTKRNLSLL